MVLWDKKYSQTAKNEYYIANVISVDQSSVEKTIKEAFNTQFRADGKYVKIVDGKEVADIDKLN